uniref:Uncharacterized protein n=1 Tax=Podoviridae sp. ct8Lf7 TaxID=2827723 RepID=A0A8S5S0L2_9CAUD|nr:MAG TPA: hypothetical protein [Podoviridae sp. ct8Lf7]
MLLILLILFPIKMNRHSGITSIKEFFSYRLMMEGYSIQRYVIVNPAIAVQWQQGGLNLGI